MNFEQKTLLSEFKFDLIFLNYSFATKVVITEEVNVLSGEG